MITKLRRAFTQLNLQEAITLIAVTRSGYRLLVREANSELQQAEPLPLQNEPAEGTRQASSS